MIQAGRVTGISKLQFISLKSLYGYARARVMCSRSTKKEAKDSKGSPRATLAERNGQSVSRKM